MKKFISLPDGSRYLEADGFTLIELTFVMVILTLFASLTVVMVHKSFELRSQSMVVQNLVDLMGFAHERAIAESTKYGVQFGSDAKTYWMVRSANDGLDDSPVRISSVWGRSQLMPNGTSIQSNISPVLFFPDGTATQASVQVMSGNQSFTVVVNPVTGRSDFHDGI